MNKQEAIEKIKGMKIGGMDSDEVKKEALYIVSQINEPQKVIVPKYVADWYEKNKYVLDIAINKKKKLLSCI